MGIFQIRGITDQGSSLPASVSAARSLVFCFDFDGDSGLEADGEVILEDRNLCDQAHLLILDYAVDLGLLSHVPKPENFIRDGVVVSLLVGLLHELLLQIPEAFVDDLRRQGISLFDHCGNVGLQGFQEVVLFYRAPD